MVAVRALVYISKEYKAGSILINYSLVCFVFSFVSTQILDLVKGMHYQLACQKYFELTHNVRASLTGHLMKESYAPFLPTFPHHWVESHPCPCDWRPDWSEISREKSWIKTNQIQVDLKHLFSQCVSPTHSWQMYYVCHFQRISQIVARKSDHQHHEWSCIIPFHLVFIDCTLGGVGLSKVSASSPLGWSSAWIYKACSFLPFSLCRGIQFVQNNQSNQ